MSSVPPASRNSVLTQRLLAHAASRPDQPALTFRGLAGDTETLTWGGTRDATAQLAAYLRAAGCAPGEVVLILTASPREQILAFLAALACGAVPSILSYPSAKQSHAMFWRMLHPVLEQSRAQFLLHAAQFAGLVAGEVEQAALLQIPDPAQLPAPSLEFPGSSGDGGDRTLFRQFSSGTTGARKSVLISEAMFASHAEAYGAAIGFGDGDCVVSWLPLYHDLGLVGSFLIPLHHGVHSVHLSPFEWLQRPAMLFDAIAQHGGTLVWMPNFAYSYCAQRIAAADLDPALDLGPMRAFVSGGEPVTAKAQDEFVARFAARGLERRHLQTIYGMAENTLCITQSALGAAIRHHRVDRDAFLREHRAVPAAATALADDVFTFVSCGRPIADTELRIAGSREERTIGEIEVRGASLFAGYTFAEGGEAGTEGVFTADGWFRTGDLGYLDGGELFVTGRAKDVIIHRGSNIYPTEVEDVLGRLPGCKPGRVAVFGVYDDALGTEEVVAMLESAAELAAPARRELESVVRAEALARFGLPFAEVVVMAPQSLQKSTSGKISRNRNRDAYVAQRAQQPAAGDAAEAVGGTGIAPRDLHETQVAEVWQAVLGGPRPTVHLDFFSDLGGDSVRAVQVIEQLNRRFGADFGPELLLEARTVETQARALRERDGEQQVLVTFHTEGAGRPIFLAHPAGGSVFGYHHVASALPDRPVYGLQDPHIFGSDGVFFESIEEMAAAYVPHIRRQQPHGPYLLGGWSLGGVLAFELANRLVAAGEEVAHLVLFDAPSPPDAGERRRLFWQHVPARVLLQWMARVPLLRAVLAPLTIHRRIRRGGWDPISCARELARFDLEPTPGALRLFFPDAPAVLLEQGLGALLRDAVHEAEARDNIVPGVDPANHVQRRRIHQRNLTKLFRSYRPAWRYAGKVTLFRQSEEAVAPWRDHWSGYYHWDRFCVGELDVQVIELLATPEQPDPHENTLLKLNTERYMPLVRAALAAGEAR